MSSNRYILSLSNDRSIRVDFEGLSSTVLQLSSAYEETRQIAEKLALIGNDFDSSVQGRVQEPFGNFEATFRKQVEILQSMLEEDIRNILVFLQYMQGNASLHGIPNASSSGESINATYASVFMPFMLDPGLMVEPQLRMEEMAWASRIRGAGKEYDIDSVLVGAILEDEGNRRGVEDFFQERLMSFFSQDTVEDWSIGDSQMKFETLYDLVDNGYIEKPDNWDSDRFDLAKDMLTDDDLAPTLVAARLRQTIDYWEAQGGPNLSERPEILATLYSIGLTGDQGVHSNPQPSERGKGILELFDDVREKLDGDRQGPTHIA